MPTMPPNEQDTLARLISIADAAGRIALGFFRLGDTTRAGIDWKGDGTPVTEADLAVNVFLEQELRRLWPDAAWLSEESADDLGRLEATSVIVVDPIDGTRGFARGDANWSIAIALVETGRPVMAIVHGPALGETYIAVAGEGAWLNGRRLQVRIDDTPLPDMHVTCPRVLADALRAVGIRFDFQPKIASLALRIAKVASGVYDAGFATRNSHDWDLAAADLVLQEAGGLLVGPDGKPLTYNRPDPSHGILTASPRALQPGFRAVLARTSYGQELV